MARRAEAVEFAEVTGFRGGGAEHTERSAPPPLALLLLARRGRARQWIAVPYFAAVVVALSTSTMTSCMRHGVTAVRA